MVVAWGQTLAAPGDPKVRPAYCAGRWYPGDVAALSSEVESLLAQASPPSVEGKPIAVISPHAGYSYSDPVAARVRAVTREVR